MKMKKKFQGIASYLKKFPKKKRFKRELNINIVNQKSSQEWLNRLERYVKKRGLQKKMSFLLEPKKLKVFSSKKEKYLPLVYKGTVTQYYSPVPIVGCVLDSLINAGLHIGSNYKRFRQEASFFLLGKRHSIFLINLVGSLFFLRKGLAYLGKSVSLKVPVLLVLSKKEGRDYLSKRIHQLGHFATSGRYIPGTISNYRHVRAFPELPGVICLGDTSNCGLAINECRKLEIPFFGICDSDMDPSWFFFPIFGNNDSLEGSKLLYVLFRETLLVNEKKIQKEFLDLDLRWRSVLKTRVGG